MGKRQKGYLGVASLSCQGMYVPDRPEHHSTFSSPRPPTTHSEVQDLFQNMIDYFWAAYSYINGNYLVVATVFLVVLLSFMLPDISQKIHRTQELKAMKKAIDLVTDEVSRAEVACLTTLVGDQIGFLKKSMHDGTTDTVKNQQQDLGMCTTGLMHVTRSAPVQPEKIGFFRRFFYTDKNASYKEVIITSYVYTDSFNATKKSVEIYAD